MQNLTNANIYLLEQAERLLQDLADQDYISKDGQLHGASVGQHLRHCLDHYLSFLGGYAKGAIDYDHRARAGDIECSTECASKLVRELCEGLEKAAEMQAAEVVKVKMDCGGGDQAWYPSTLGRELQFLASHTIHHYAMIHSVCQRRGFPLEEGFGVAPSTLAHRKLAKID